MKCLQQFLGALVLLSTAVVTQAASIDKMFTATYNLQYQPGYAFVLFSQADHYLLSDGSSWEAGAGSHPVTYATLKSVESDGQHVRYTFEAAEYGLLFRNIDYDSGDHSAQGELGASNKLVLVAKLGSTQGKLTGYTRIISNDETWYGQPRFNFYSAAVGERVSYRQDFVLRSATFTPDLFDTTFEYDITGMVDFTTKK